MILRALCDYYDLLCKIEGSDISPYGYQKVDASYVAVLTKDGALTDIISLRQLNDNRPQKFTTPTSMKSSSIAASPVCDNFEYVFGMGGEKGIRKTTKEKFEVAKKLHLKMFSNGTSPEAVAIFKFFEQWDADQAWENELVLQHYSDKGKAFSGNVVFRLVGSSTYFHDVPEIIDIWNKKLSCKKTLETIAQCSVTGESAPIARLHDKLSGIKDASTMGASLVCFNKDADESYGLGQARNAAVSEQAAFKYVTVLQHMLSSKEQHLFIGDATTVFWSSQADPCYINVFKSILYNPDEPEDESINEDLKTREIVKSVLIDGSKGVYNQIDDANFFVLGLSPNAGRTSVRFYYQNTFFAFCKKIKLHYDDTSIYGGKNGKNHIKISSILYATVSSKSKDKKVNPLLSGSVARAILTGEMYPQILLSQTIIRVKAESEITQARAAVIKGCITRKNRISKREEDLSMYLNEDSTNAAYVLGRTFAILEMIQKNALGEGINATIKTKYFASACSNPALIFPNLLKLAQHHLAKIEGNYWNIKLGDCIGKLEGESFPKILNMENQGRFILGYYQQNQKNYEKRQ
ncbi:MAG: type I-C CRISPR-associated protein Cas8c/Csd1 [Alkaliphilus sp.]